MVGEIIKNQNGKQYVVLAKISEDRALIHGGNDYVVIDDLNYFRVTGSWGNGKYFPCFNAEEDSYRMLRRALHYLKHYTYIQDEEQEEEY